MLREPELWVAAMGRNKADVLSNGAVMFNSDQTGISSELLDSAISTRPTTVWQVGSQPFHFSGLSVSMVSDTVIKYFSTYMLYLFVQGLPYGHLVRDYLASPHRTINLPNSSINAQAYTPPFGYPAWSTGFAGPPVWPSEPPTPAPACLSDLILSRASCCSAFFLSKSLTKSCSLPPPPEPNLSLPATAAAMSPSPGAAICAPSSSLCRPTSSSVSPLASSPAGAPWRSISYE